MHPAPEAAELPQLFTPAPPGIQSQRQRGQHIPRWGRYRGQTAFSKAEPISGARRWWKPGSVMTTIQQRFSCEGKCSSPKAIFLLVMFQLGKYKYFTAVAAQVLTEVGVSEAEAQEPERERNGWAGLPSRHLCLSLPVLSYTPAHTHMQTHACMHMHCHTHLHRHAHTCRHSCTGAHTHAGTHKHADTHRHVHTHTHACTLPPTMLVIPRTSF